MAYSNITISTTNTNYTPANLLAPPSLEGADIQISGIYNLPYDDTQDTIMLIGHADTADGIYEPRPVYNAQEVVNYLGADENSPLLRSFLQLVDGGCKNIVIYPVAPMSEYVDDSDLSKRFELQSDPIPKSLNIESWDTSDTGMPNNLSWRGIAWSPKLGIFCVVGLSGDDRILTSPDGVNWTSHTAPANNQWVEVCWSPELEIFCAISSNGTNRVMTSPDGVNWTLQTTPNNQWQDICWASSLGIFCVVGNSGTGDRVMTSPDGVTWTSQTTPADLNWTEICWAEEIGLFVACSASNGFFMISEDGVNWSTVPYPISTGVASICWSPELNLFCTVSFNGTGNRAMTSPDGINWTVQTTPVDNDWLDVIWVSELGLFCAVADTGSGDRVMTSPDGVNWTVETNVPDSAYAKIAWSPELSLLCGISYLTPSNNFLIGSTIAVYDQLPDDSLFPKITERTDLTWTNNNFYERYYNRLQIAYAELIETGLLQGIGIVVPVEAPFYDTGGVDFAGQLVDLCYTNFVEHGGITCGVMGTRIQNFNEDSALAMINDPRLDPEYPTYYLEHGKFVMVVVGEGIISHRTTSLTYRAPLDVQAAINLALFPDDRSIAYSRLRGCVNTTYSLVNGQDNTLITDLANARLNPVIKTARGRRNFVFETRLATDNTLDKSRDLQANANRSFWSMSQTHLLAGIVNKIQEFSDDFIGDSMGDIKLQNFKTTVQQFITSILSKGIIRDYSLNFEEEPSIGRITIKIGILPVFALKHLYFEITTGPEVR